MAKICDHHFKSWTVSVTYTTKKAAFKIDLPEEMKTFAEVCAGDESGRDGYIVAATEAEVARKFDALAGRYLVEGVKREKFLAVVVSDGGKDGFDYHDDFSHGGGKCGFLSIKWMPVERVDVAGKFQYKFWRHGTERNFNRSNAVFLSWSPSREAFLKSTTDSLHDTAERVKAFFESPVIATKIDLNKICLIDFNSKKDPK